MKRSAPRFALLLLLTFDSACAVAPTAAPGPQTERVYMAIDPATASEWGQKVSAQYILFGNGTFVLEHTYANARLPIEQHPDTVERYFGTYREADGHVVFEFAEPWFASGTLTAQWLDIHYTDATTQDAFKGFIDGRFLRRLRL